MSRRVLLTGAGGFVGSHVLRHFLEHTDWHLIVTDSFRHVGSMDRIGEQVKGEEHRGRLEVVVANLAVPFSPQLRHRLGRLDYIVNVASDSDVDGSILHPTQCIENNVQLMLTMLEYARQAPVRKFLHVSTDEVYGPALGGYRHREGEPHRPSNPYCLPPDVQICTNPGTRAISDVDPWVDRLVSRHNSTLSGQQAARAKWSRPYSGDLVCLRTEHGETRSTPEHVFFRRGCGYSGDPMQGLSGIWLPGRPHAKVEEVSAGELRVGDHVMMARRLPAPHGGGRRVDLRLARFLGYFVGDGSYSSRSRYVHLADQSRARLERYRDLLKDALGVSPKAATGAFGTIYKHRTKDCHYLQFASERLRALVDLGQPKERLAWSLAGGCNGVLSEFVAGFLEAEAHYAYRGSRLQSVVAFQSSRGILDALQFYLRRLGIVGQIRPHRQGHRLTVTDNKSLALLTALPVDKLRANTKLARSQFPNRAAKALMWSRVAEVSRERYDGPVYDLEMAGEPNFLADYFVVHNSASKACQEDICFAYWRTYGLPIVISNTMNIVGEMQAPEKFVPGTIAKVLRGETVKIHASADGKVGSRHYLHARNQADALLFILEHCPEVWAGARDLQRINVVGEREVDNLEMAKMIARFAKRPLTYDLVDCHSSRPGHDLRYALDGSKLAALGWKAPLPLEESLRRTVSWTLAHPEWLLRDEWGRESETVAPVVA